MLYYIYMHNTLESHKLFPYIAWGLVIGFAAFTLNLTLTIQREISDIAALTGRIEQTLTPPSVTTKATQ